MRTRLNCQSGMSMVEVTITTLIFALVLSFVVYVTFFVGKQANILSAESKAEMEGRNAAELVRFHLQMAKLADPSPSITNSNRTITFKNPMFGTSSKLEFNSGTHSLAYHEDVDSAATRTLRGVEDIQFTERNFGAMIEVTVETEANALGGDKIIPVSQTFTVRPRN